MSQPSRNHRPGAVNLSGDGITFSIHPSNSRISKGAPGGDKDVALVSPAPGHVISHESEGCDTAELSSVATMPGAGRLIPGVNNGFSGMKPGSDLEDVHLAGRGR